MARTKKVRKSQSVNNILSQNRLRSQEEESEEDEQDCFIDSDEQSNGNINNNNTVQLNGGDGHFKRPFVPIRKEGCSSTKPIRRISASNLDLSVKKYAQEKLPIVREVREIAKLAETCIHFVTEENGSLSRYMKFAYEYAMSSTHIDASTISKTNALVIMKMLEAKQQVVGIYVLEFFEGVLYDMLLEHSKTERKCRIFGPDVFIQSKNIDHIPRTDKPLFSLTMYNLTVCSTSYSVKEKDDFATKVAMMGGKFSKILLKNTSVLIAKDVVSQKSQLARKHKIPIVSREWVAKCWTSAYRQTLSKAVDKIKECKLPLFQGAIISVSQIDSETRLRLEKGAKKYGYIYQPDLSEHVTHLICLREEGAKFDFSREHNIYTVQYEWVKQSIKAEYALPEVDFMIGGPLDKDDDDPLQLKAPKPSKPVAKPPVATTTIVPVFGDSQEQLEERQEDDQNDAHSSCKQQNSTQTIQKPSSQKDERDDFTSCVQRCLKKQSCGLLDNYEINLCGFKDDLLFTLCKQLIAHEAGFCSMKISESTTVVVVSDGHPEKETVRKYMVRNDLFCPVVGQRWLTDSIEKSRLEPFDSYLMFSNDNDENEEHNADDLVEEVIQPSLGFVVTKKDRSMMERAKRGPSQATDVSCDQSQYEGTFNRRSVNIFESVQETTKSYERTDEESWTTEADEEEMDCQEKEEEHKDEHVQDEESSQESDDTPSSSFSYSTQACGGPSSRRNFPKVATQAAPKIGVPDKSARTNANLINNLAGNYYKGEEKRECLEKWKEAGPQAGAKRRYAKY